MDSSSNTALFDADIWHGKTFNGRWHASPHAADVIEPATGNTLGRLGLADGAAVAEASAAAHRAQPAWFALPYDERAAVLRRAATVAETHFDAIVDWLVRESGSTRAKASFETSVTIK
ncbi:aldehyde dehydrogenase family protein, partial [Burkholderia cepacia]|nr:aldehyde dehydrogenase family protein [Burkholderia cepacia]